MILSDINLEHMFQVFNTDQKTKIFTAFVGKSFEVAQTIKSK